MVVTAETYYALRSYPLSKEESINLLNFIICQQLITYLFRPHFHARQQIIALFARSPVINITIGKKKGGFIFASFFLYILNAIVVQELGTHGFPQTQVPLLFGIYYEFFGKIAE